MKEIGLDRAAYGTDSMPRTKASLIYRRTKNLRAVQAGTLRAQGDLAGGRRLEERALEGRRRVLGEEHPDTLSSMNNLAETLRAQGDLAGAREHHERVLELSRRVLGEEHLATLWMAN